MCEAIFWHSTLQNFATPQPLRAPNNKLHVSICAQAQRKGKLQWCEHDNSPRQHLRVLVPHLPAPLALATCPLHTPREVELAMSKSLRGEGARGGSHGSGGEDKGVMGLGALGALEYLYGMGR